MMLMTHESRDLLRPLHELLAVAATGHVTEAAHELGTPQPTLSRSLARLAESVGAPLLLRQGRGVVLSRHGRLLADAAERAVAEVDVALRQIRAEVDPGAGLVRLGFQHAMGIDLVPEVLRRFKQTHPRVGVQLTQGGGESLVEDAASGVVDLGLVAVLDPALGPGLTRRVLGTQDLVLLVPRRHAVAKAPQVSLADVAAEPFIAMARGYGLRTITDRLLREVGLATRPAYETEDIATAAGLVAAGLGVTVAPAGVGRRDLVEVPLTAAAGRAERIVQLVWNPTALESAPVAALHDAVLAVAPGMLTAP